MEDNPNHLDLERFKTVYDIDRVKHPDTEKVKICGKELELGKVRALYSNFDEKKYKMMSFYDDMYQYTSLGLLDVLFDAYDISSPIPVKSFFARKQTYGKEFVYTTAERFGITKEEVDEIEKKCYGQIVMRSPLSSNAEGFFKMRALLDAQLLVFKYPFDGIDTCVRELKETFGKDEYISLEVDFRGTLTEQEYYEKIGKPHYSYFDIAICQDAASLIEFMEQKKIQDTIILTGFDHCGLSTEAKYTYEVLTEGVGPRNSRIYYVKEGF